MYYAYEFYALRIWHINVLNKLTNINSKCLETEYIK